MITLLAQANVNYLPYKAGIFQSVIFSPPY
jgi:hypothetical protein